MIRTLNQDLNQKLELSKETYEGRGYNYEFLGVTDIQLKIEITKTSLWAATNLQDDLKTNLSLY